jgi:hypothetical protein
MPFVTTPTGDTFEETSPVALDYYRREPGYKVRDSEDEDRPPAKSALKADWLDYARAHGFEGDDDAVTRQELIDTYGGG